MSRPATAGLLLLTIAMILTAVSYWPGLDGGFYFDDRPNIVEATALHWEELPSGNWRAALAAPRHPERVVPNITFALNHLWGGLEPRGYHIVNLVLHLLMGISVAWLCYLMATERTRPALDRAESSQAAMKMAPIGAALAAALFLLHPLNIQAVTYVVQRMASLAGLFSVLSFCLYLQARRSASRRSWWFLALSGLAWLLAVGSKQNGLMVPVVMLAYEFCFRSAHWCDRLRQIAADPRRRWRLAAALSLFVTGIIAVDHLYLGGLRLNWSEAFPNRDFGGWERILTQARVHWLYLSLLLWPSPSRLNLDHDFRVSRSLLEPGTLLAVLGWTVVLAGAIWLARRQPRYAFPLVAYMLLHGAESGPVNLELVFEHRMYLPMAFLVLLVSVFFVDMGGLQRSFVATLFVLVLLPLSLATHQRNLVWADFLGFHRDCARKSPGKYRPQYNLGTELGRRGFYEEAIPALLSAISLRPQSSQAYNQLGAAYQYLGRTQEAVSAFRRAVEFGPGNAEAHYNLGSLLAETASAREAIPYYQRFVEIAPPSLSHYRQLVQAQLSRWNQAEMRGSVTGTADEASTPGSEREANLSGAGESEL